MNSFGGSSNGGGMPGYGNIGQGIGQGLGQFLGGLFGDSGAPYEDYMDQLRRYQQMSEGVQNPYLQAGQGGLGNYQNWLSKMQDPTKFINDTMGQYQESPWAKYLQQQSMRAGQNAASALGTGGSTPFAEQLQQNASNISSGDMQNWLSRVLGINSQYGQGNQFLSGLGANAANQMTNMYGNLGQQMGQGAYGKRAGENQDFMNMLSGGGQLFGNLAMLPFMF